MVSAVETGCYCFSCAENAELTPVLHLCAGACAGIIAMSARYPMDMVWGRLTVQVSRKSIKSLTPVGLEWFRRLKIVS